MIPDSMLSGENAAYIDELYERWCEDPAAVAAPWQDLFAAQGPPVSNRAPHRGPPTVFGAHASGADVDASAALRQAKVAQLINAYRVRAHLDAEIDPLKRRKRVIHDELKIGYYGLGEADLDADVETWPVFGLPPRARLRDLIAHLRSVYCDAIGAEFMNIMDNTQKRWVQEQLETLPGRGVLTPEEERRVFAKLCDAENFERMLHGKYPGTKRFSLEGGETLIPLLDLVIERSAAVGVREVVIGMAHRGRLNTLVNTLEKPVEHIVREFEGVVGETQGSGDVKYHLGYSADVVTVEGHPVHLSLTPNPSHLEVVNGVVEGRVRAKQDRSGDVERRQVMPLLIHGDAAFAGQGSVMECLNLAELDGYHTGGTIHVIVNNQIGFTTPPDEARSTTYATDIARMLAVPILHVNGESPRAVAAAVEIAVGYRHKFQRDVVIDMYCYRKHGHNEGDEPSFTQPMMVKAIRDRPTPRQVYAAHLRRLGTLTDDACQRIYEASFRRFQDSAADAVENGSDAPSSELRGLWTQWTSGSLSDKADTTVDVERVKGLLAKVSTLPNGFPAHAKIKRLMAARHKMLEGDGEIDWALAEQAAFATLLAEGHDVRLSGQDSGRGTFSHRHAVVTDVTTGRSHVPLSDIAADGSFSVIDSSLSELAVLAFEVGYAFDIPDALVMWEAQFGDFANGAQIVIDQYLAASQQKWNRHCGLVLLLPHGFEGQGPEHSSARLERFLQLCAEDNMQVANCTTPANFFHLLRRQVLRRVRRPLIVMTPKSLLRHPRVRSPLVALASGGFRPVIDDPDRPVGPSTRRIVLCSGKVYYDLLQAREEGSIVDVSLVRVEELYPTPTVLIRSLADRAPDAELVWCQEEPRNMGAWLSMEDALRTALGERPLRYVGRVAAASPATGSHQTHLAEQQALVGQALTFSE